MYRALATANGLVEAGFDVTVLTCEREAFVRNTGVDHSLEARVRPEIDVVRIPFDWQQNDLDIRRWPRARARGPLRWRDWKNAQDVRDYPEVTYGPWRRPLIRAAEDVHRRRRVDLTIATANPNVDVEAAHVLFERHGIPFVLDQRDAWTLDVFTGARTTDDRILEREATYMRDAHQCWFVNDPISEWHAQQYPGAAEKIFTVSNGYDADFAAEPQLLPAPGDLPLTFGYVGTVTRAMPLQELVAGWTLARESHSDVASARGELWGYLGFYAAGDSEVAKLLADADGLSYCGPVEKTGVAARYASFDVLLLVLGSGRFVTSGKVFEYMATGLPIVSVHAADIDAARVLREYPLWFPAERLDAAAIAESLAAAAAAARSAGTGVRRQCVDHASRWERSRQLRPRLDALLSSVMSAGA